MTAESRGCDKCGRPFGVGLDLTQIANASLYELDRLRAENAALRKALKDARREAFEEAAMVCEDSRLSPFQIMKVLQDKALGAP